MPFEDAADYRFNPLDLTKVWPHGDYPLIEVGRMTLNRNPDNYFAEVEQSAFEPANMVPGIGPSPDKMLLGRLFSYPDTHRYRIGPNYMDLPVNQPKSPVHSYAKDGPMRYSIGSDPVYAPNTYGGPKADPRYADDVAAYGVTDEIVRSAYRLHAEDDDFGQPGTLVRKVFNDEQRARAVRRGDARGLTGGGSRNGSGRETTAGSRGGARVGSGDRPGPGWGRRGGEGSRSGGARGGAAGGGGRDRKRKNAGV